MAPPADTSEGKIAGPTVQPAVAFFCEALKKRSDFLAAAQAARQSTVSMTVQARNRKDGQGNIRVGFTCSKKVGNAVARNRAKRRLRAVARLLLPTHGLAGYDYVLIGRPNISASRPYTLLAQDFETALTRLHAPRLPSPDRT